MDFYMNFIRLGITGGLMKITADCEILDEFSGQMPSVVGYE